MGGADAAGDRGALSRLRVGVAYAPGRRQCGIPRRGRARCIRSPFGAVRGLDHAPAGHAAAIQLLQHPPQGPSISRSGDGAEQLGPREADVRFGWLGVPQACGGRQRPGVNGGSLWPARGWLATAA